LEAPIAPPPPAASQAPANGRFAAAADAFPTGWELKRESWHFHRRWHAVFRRPMRPGEYSQLLRQIRHGHAEHLGNDAYRVTLVDERTPTLLVRAGPWRLITILPKDWSSPEGRATAPAENGHR
jgi:hypothetical protein